MKLTRRKIWLAAALLVGAAVALPSLVHFKVRRVSSIMSHALGRDVTLGAASLRLLPRPAFELHYVTIGEDSSFGAEPMMTAPLVVASLRLSSLWRGRLDFSSISFRESDGVAPSMNLVRRSDGQWSLPSLMRSAQAVPAPAGTSAPDAPAQFPYVEVLSGRLNFKSGVEKKVVALTDADFAFWAASDQEWHARMKARIIRTDASLSDTGTLQLEAAIRRGPAQLGNAPTLHLQARLRDAQLGQLSALVYGRDRGWRGAADIDVTVAGPLARPNLVLRSSVDDFRRFDLAAAQPLRLQAMCSGQLDPARESLEDFKCEAPSGGGQIVLSGSVAGMASPNYSLRARLHSVPVAAAVSFLRRVKRDVPADLGARGIIDAELLVSRLENGSSLYSGHGTISDLKIMSGNGDLQFPEVKVEMGSAGKSAGFRITAGPLNVALGGDRPASLSGQFDGAGYRVALSGPVAIEDAVRAARMFGLPAPGYPLHGGAGIHLQVAGLWAGFAPPEITGTAQLSGVSAGLAGVGVPLHITAAQLELTPSVATLRNISGTFPGGPVFSGTVQVPRGCGHPQDCVAVFNLRSAELDLSRVRLALAAQAQSPWYRVFTPAAPAPSFFGRVRATGHLSLSRLAIHSLVATRVEANASLDNGVLQLDSVDAQIFGGRHRGAWSADFSGPEPRYSGRGRVLRALPVQAAPWIADDCCSGAVDFTFTVYLAGTGSAELLRSATADIDFTWRNGALNRFALPVRLPRVGPSESAGALHFAQFTGHAALRQSSLELTRSRMRARTGLYRVSGTVSPDRRLALMLASNSGQYSIGGTLDAPIPLLEGPRASTHLSGKLGPGTY
ncbi:MAG: hypothetical protein JO041_10710 [Acidobacteria bacterium]|nr:hypothetical protein [Acidobacteriota bacterium]